MNRFYCLIGILFIATNINAQTQISGIVKNAEKQTVIDNAAVLLYDANTNKILEYQYTNEEGVFSFTKHQPEGIFRIDASKLGFEKSSQTVVIGTDQVKKLTVELALRPKNIALDEVVVQGQKPIIVKKDTIIYNTDFFIENHDESLEKVLAKIDGFKIHPDGSIEVNGKVIRKVLIDGKEVSDFGAAMLTKTIDPKNVQNIEVRFDEKDKKIKESLIDGEKFVVLDIKLKKNIKKSFFGKQQINTGYQNNLKLGGITNLFSLNSKINVQFFAENNNFNKNTIQLEYIRNIGEEAFNKIFSIPVDINDLKKRSTYQEDIYGFQSFMTQDKSIGGLSLNLPLSEKTDLYVGTFANYHFIEKGFERQLFLGDSLLDYNDDQGFIAEYQSKSKVQLKHTSDNLKLLSDINYIYFDQQTRNIVHNPFGNAFRKKQYENNFYFNNLLEYLITKKWGFTSKFSFKNEDYTTFSHLQKQSRVFPSLFQENKNRYKTIASNNELSFLSEMLGTHYIGYEYTLFQLENEKIANENAFGNPKTKLSYQKNSIYYKLNLFLGDFFIKGRLAYSFLTFPTPLESFPNGKNSLPEYEATLTYNWDNFTNISASIEKNITTFPLHKIVSGNLLLDYQTIFTSSQNIFPTYNTSYTANFNKIFNNKSELEVAYLHGQTKNQNNYVYKNDFIHSQANQLANQFNLYSIKYKKRLSPKFWLTISPEYLGNQTEYLQENLLETSQAHRFINSLDLLYKENENFSATFLPKYAHFIFKNSTTTHHKAVNFLNTSVLLKKQFINNKLLSQLHVQHIYFFKDKHHFTNLDAELVYKTLRFRYILGSGNLFNEHFFTTYDLNESFLEISKNSIFKRYVYLAFEFKF